MQIYLDYAATTPVDIRVSEAMYDWQKSFFGNPSSPHRHGQSSKIKLEEVRDLLASKINCQSKEVVFTSGGTESNNNALIGACLANKDKGNHVLVSAIEHPSVLDSIKFLEGQGFEVSYFKPEKNGEIDLQKFEDSIRPNTILASMMHINNETGSIFPIKEIGEVCKQKDILFHCDAVQAFAKMYLNVQELNVDLMSFSAHKIYGPKGVGGLFIRDGVLLEALSFGGGQEANKRPGTENLTGIIGFGKAVELMENHITEWREVKLIQKYFESELLSKIPGLKVNGDSANRSPYISNLSFVDFDNQSTLLKLDMAGISASVGSACSSGSIKQSQVLRGMNLPDAIINSAIRFSFGRFTTKQEIEQAVEIILQVLEK
ncbi:MAG: cysteine desulfurase [Calditrichaeota bacterium]|nr:MAG: cysteine desulfurase [Calditrichota bacterium]MBL1205122.1 cysteine desulfurase [Calditrichota bacterium]NOG44952.1 cysteine desulfurase [Calditrichota bacterium]